MTNEEILKKAIDKVIENSFVDETMVTWDKFDIATYKAIVENKSYYQAIFSHNFAKAFWGKQKHEGMEYELDGYCNNCQNTIDENEHPRYCWQYHLTQMVLEKEPLKYLEKFL